MNKPSNHQARKRFGQNFLHDQNIIHRIVDSVTAPAGTSLIEIGPGQGALTAPLLDRFEKLTAIEIDRDLASALTIRFVNNKGFKLVNTDILKVPLASLTNDGSKLSVVGNLPYNISTPLIFHLLQQPELIHSMVFMLQKEVVERMAAKPGNADYGRLSLMVQYYCEVEQLFLVPPSAFRPAPKVESAMVRLVPHTTLPSKAENPELFARIVREAFNQRRKTIRNSLKTLVDDALFDELGIDGSRRPDTLSLNEYVSICNALKLD